MTNSTAIIRRHVEATIHMLLGNDVLGAGLAVLGGGTLDHLAKMKLAGMAAASETDVVHLAFGEPAGSGAELVDISVFVPRGIFCHAISGCSLYIAKGGARALILPPATDRGHFRAERRELVHVDGKPRFVREGVGRATQRLQSMAQTNIDIQGQAIVTQIADGDTVNCSLQA